MLFILVALIVVMGLALLVAGVAAQPGHGRPAVQPAWLNSAITRLREHIEP